MEYEDFREILKNNNLSIKDFSKLSEVSYKTCTKWGKENRPVPSWVNSWFQLYTENQECKKYKESMQTLMSGLNTDK